MAAHDPPGIDSRRNGLLRRAHAFTNLFQIVERALTTYEHVVTVPSATPARDALRLLQQHRFSQVPVVDSGRVAGMFSYRSFALAVAAAFDLPGRHRADGLSVWECIETPSYLQATDDVQRLFTELDRRDAVLVGAPGQCKGILTAMGVMQYLYEAASPFLLIAEIELSLRALIEFAVDSDELKDFASTSLTRYKSEDLPTRLEDMTFNDYVLLIGHGKNWPRFNRIFQADRSLTQAKLNQVRELRNDVFHHRRSLVERDRNTLVASRDWMVRLVEFALDIQELS